MVIVVLILYAKKSELKLIGAVLSCAEGAPRPYSNVTGRHSTFSLLHGPLVTMLEEFLQRIGLCRIFLNYFLGGNPSVTQ